MAEDIIGSKFKSNNGPGQNGDDRASSSTKLGTKQPPSGDWQTRHVGSEGAVPTHHASRDVNASPKQVPGAVDYKKG